MNFYEIMNELQIPIMPIENAPDLSGVYLLFDINGSFIYVGKATNLQERLQQHFFDSEKNPVVQKYATFASVFRKTTNIYKFIRKDARVIEWTGLEIRRTVLPYRGFESHSFRNKKAKRRAKFT